MQMSTLNDCETTNCIKHSEFTVLYEFTVKPKELESRYCAFIIRKNVLLTCVIRCISTRLFLSLNENFGGNLTNKYNTLKGNI